MAKKTYEIKDFSGGLNQTTDKRKIQDNELSFAINARINEQGVYQSKAPTLKQHPKGKILEVQPTSPLRINHNHPKYNKLTSPKPNLSIVDRLLTTQQKLEPPGTQFNRNMKALSDLGVAVARDTIEQTPAGLGASVGQQVGSGDILGALSSALGGKITTIEKLPKNRMKLPKPK